MFCSYETYAGCFYVFRTTKQPALWFAGRLKTEFLGAKTGAAVSTAAVLAGQTEKIFCQAVQYVFGAFAVFGKEPIFAIWIVNTEFPAFIAEIHPRFICNQIGAKGGGQSAETDNPPH